MPVLEPCAGAVVHDAQRRLLLIRRGRPPGAGLWSIPGGRCLPDEDAAAACVREAREETGLDVVVTAFAGRVHRPGIGDHVFVIDDFACRVVGGTLAAADDASDARWVSAAELRELPLVPGLLDALGEWGLLPR